MKNHSGEKEIKGDPYKNANILSKISFWWILPLLWKGFSEDLKKTDVNEQIANLRSEELTNKFHAKWHHMKKNGSKSIIKLIIHFYGSSYVASTIIQVIIEVLSKVTQVICLGGLTSYFSANQNNTSNFEAYVYAAGLVTSIFFLSLSTNFYALFATQIGLRIRLGCSGLIYKKILENKKYVSGFNGRAIQILTNDMKQMIFALNFANFVILGPAETCALGYLMYREIGLSAICGIFTCLIFLPCQVLSSRFAGKYLRAKSKHTDSRLKLLTEVIQGIQVIKMYSWEKLFYNSLIKIRKTELKELWGTLKIRAGVNSLRMVSVVAIFVSLLSHVYFGEQLSARKVFITSLVFSLINSSMVRFWTTSLTYCSEAYVSANRIQDFLLEGFVYKPNNVSDETELISKDLNAPIQEILYTKIKNNNLDTQMLGIWLKNIVVKRKAEQENENDKIVLNNINLTINGNNNLIAIVGPVGSGKSTLFNLILGEVEIESGSIEINGTISYASQQPWIFEGTIQENILFTEILDEKRYAEVIKVCALEKDIENLPQKHLTHIGERGINLSGGQKARINLARAIYKKADIYLLDDPFSSVDAEVGHYIFDKCVATFLSGKICLLVTHQLIYLKKNVSQIIVMKSGGIILQDFLNNLENSNELNFLYKSQESEKIVEPIISETKIVNGSKNEVTSDHSNQEKSETGSIKWVVYQSLMKLAGWTLFGITILLAVISTVSLNGLSYFLRNWVDWEESQANSTNLDYMESYRHYHVLEYSFFVVVALILNTTRYFVISYVCITISKTIFISLLQGVIQANIYFFNLNSSGRIINRFSNDLGLIDSQLSISLQYIIALLTDVPAAAIVVSIINPWLLIPSIVISMAFYLIRKVYIKTSRNIKRIDALSQSPINSHVNETFQGLATIRILKGEMKMTTKFHKYQDFSVSTYFFDASTYRCFTVWIEFFCTLYIGVIAYSFIVYQDIFTSGDVGLAIFLCMSTVQTLQFAIKFSASFENQLTSVERIIEYANQPNESTLNYPKTKEKEINWPTEGSIEFKDFSLKYGPNTNSILKNINFKIEAKEKVAIVGRTGSGKSSIIQAIFRLVFNEGKIEIDGIDVNKLDLHDLRSKISIIPQDSILFSGTIRSNLDPFKVLLDTNLWEALDEVGLKEHIITLNQGLESKVCEYGSNFSVGQRQLLCLARAILRNNKILILDEATANVDSITDALIRKTLEHKFENSTILTITHRLESITHCDRIMVVDDGNIVELDTFENLKNNSNSYFNKLFKKSI